MILLFLLTFFFVSLSALDPLFMTSITVPYEQRIVSISFESLLRSNNIDKVELTMGHLTSQYKHSPFPHHIVAHIHSQTKLSESTLTKVASAFGISQKIDYQLWDSDFKITTIADPNDKMCVQHLEFLFNLFLPCKNWLAVGLKHFVPPNSLLKEHLGLKFIWEKDQVSFLIVKPHSEQKVQTYERRGPCGHIKVQYFKPDHEQHLMRSLVQLQRKSLSQWYNPQKTNAFIIRKNHQDSLPPHNLTLISLLPAGFHFKSVELVSSFSSFDVKTQLRSDDSRLITINIQLPLQVDQLVLHMSFTSGFRLFDTYQTIGGGGQELMGLTRISKGSRFVQIRTPQVVQFLLQPDFSISFHIITFTVASILLVWLTLWRSHQVFPTTSLLEDSDY